MTWSESEREVLRMLRTKWDSGQRLFGIPICTHPDFPRDRIGIVALNAAEVTLDTPLTRAERKAMRSMLAQPDEHAGVE